ncbi:MAG: TetR/AcrR family transcriptional regulator [Actinomycetota bacterium]
MVTTEPEDPRITRTREAVLDAVAELLTEEGWERVTHQRVAERSGYARSTVYRHWPERIDLLRGLSDRAEQMSHPERVTGDLRSDLLGELLAYRDVLFDRGGGATLAALIGVAEHSDGADAVRAASVARGETPVRDLLRSAVDDGRLAAGLDPAAGASELFGPITHRRLMTRTRPDDAELADLVDGFIAHRGA